MSVKVSIIIPVFQGGRYLADCLDSVLAQTFKDFEVICVDDGSTDESSKILADYARRDGRLRVVRQENAGQGAARNRALTLANGKYVEFLDADDLIEPETLDRLVGLAEENSLDHVIFSAEPFLDGAEKVLKPVRIEQMCKAYPIPPNLVGQVLSGVQAFQRLVAQHSFFVSPCLRLLSRDMLKRNACRFAQGVFLEDTFFTPFALLASDRVMMIPDRLYRRRLHAASTMTDPKIAARRSADARRIGQLLEKRFRERGDVGALAKAAHCFLEDVYRGFLVQDALAHAGFIGWTRRVFLSLVDRGPIFALRYIKRSVWK